MLENLVEPKKQEEKEICCLFFFLFFVCLSLLVCVVLFLFFCTHRFMQHFSFKVIQSKSYSIDKLYCRTLQFHVHLFMGVKG